MDVHTCATLILLFWNHIATLASPSGEEAGNPEAKKVMLEGAKADGAEGKH